MASHFAQVDQAAQFLKKVETFIATGMDTTIEVAEDVVKGDKNAKNPKLKELREIMVEYAKLDSNLRTFVEAVEYMKQQAGNSEDEDLESILNDRLKTLEQEDKKMNMRDHEKYQELDDKIKESLAEEDCEDEDADPSDFQSYDQSGEIAMFSQVNTKCPFTGKEMKDPVKNKRCGHNYDREGANQLIKNRGAKAKCPVAGCGNEKSVTAADLEDNKELKLHIQKQTKKGKGKKR